MITEVELIGSVAAVIVPSMTVLWYVIRSEIRNQIYALQVALEDRVSKVESRVTALESSGSLVARETVHAVHTVEVKLATIIAQLQGLPCRIGSNRCENETEARG